MMPLPTPYPEVNRVLRILVVDVRAALDESFVDAYLQGSFAVGDFDEHSDCDFIIVVRDELTERQIAQLLIDATPFRNRFYQAFIVHTYCRMLHDLVEGGPGSKRAGAEWAETHLDPQWSALIDRSWSGRPNPAVSVREPSDPAEFESTLAFVRYVMKESVRRGFVEEHDCRDLGVRRT